MACSAADSTLACGALPASRKRSGPPSAISSVTSTRAMAAMVARHPEGPETERGLPRGDGVGDAGEAFAEIVVTDGEAEAGVARGAEGLPGDHRHLDLVEQELGQ